MNLIAGLFCFMVALMIAMMGGSFLFIILDTILGSWNIAIYINEIKHRSNPQRKGER
jgi:hypothetical protein